MPISEEAFVKQPTQELLNLAMKSDLVLLAKHYELAEVNTSMRKQAIENEVVKFLVYEKFLDDSGMALIEESDFKF